MSRKNKLEENKYKEGGLYVKGLDFMKECRHLKLSIQERNKDPKHQELLSKMEQGGRLCAEDLSKYKILGCEASDDLDVWSTAPILVTTNREKFDLLESQAKRVAILKGTHVIRWRCNNGQWKNKPEDKYIGDVIDKDPAFWEYFVKDSDGYVLDNINKERKLVNGSEFQYHSIVFKTIEEGLRVEALTSNMKIGSMITLREAPAAIVIKLKNANKRIHWYGSTLEPEKKRNNEDVLVPIVEGRLDSKYEEVPVRGSDKYGVSIVFIKSRFPLEPGFAFTIHKAQGKTLRRIIVALSYRCESITNLTYAHLYVALSRVKDSNDIRLLVNFNSNGRPDMESLTYIYSLKPDKSIGVFFAGFDSTAEAMPKWDEKLIIKELGY